MAKALWGVFVPEAELRIRDEVSRLEREQREQRITEALGGKATSDTVDLKDDDEKTDESPVAPENDISDSEERPS